MKTKTFYSEDELKAHLKTHVPSFYHSSRTSTVIPFDHLPFEHDEQMILGDLSHLPAHLSMKGEHLILRGAVNWQEADVFLKKHQRAIKTSPTEQLALVLAGVATSCTGERCFAFGNLRQQISSLKYLNYQGEEITLKRDDPFEEVKGLAKYQKDFTHYDSFKNAPYPRFKQASDLMIGTEGQLGIVTEIELETTPEVDVTHVFILLPPWEENFLPHLEIYQSVQASRGDIISCELLDKNCMDYLRAEERLGQNQDVILMEIKTAAFEYIYENIFSLWKHTGLDHIFEVSAAKFHHVRAAVPRAVFEENSKAQVKKMGTDCQVDPHHFANLLELYRELAKLGVRYTLFGHFGDAHLHFNYMPKPAETVLCLPQFEKLYASIKQWRGSPFAEHGIGLLKQKFIAPFLSETQCQLFYELKQRHDPYGQFFPHGFMTAFSKQRTHHQ